MLSRVEAENNNAAQRPPSEKRKKMVIQSHSLIRAIFLILSQPETVFVWPSHHIKQNRILAKEMSVKTNEMIRNMETRERG